MAYTQLLGNSRGPEIGLAKLKGGRARSHFEPVDVGEYVKYFLRDPIREIALVAVCREVRKGKYGDGCGWRRMLGAMLTGNAGCAFHRGHVLRKPELIDQQVRDPEHEEHHDRAIQTLPGQLPDGSVGINLDSRLQSLRSDLVDPREQKHNRKADGQQNDNQPVGPGRNLQHVKDDVYGGENE